MKMKIVLLSSVAAVLAAGAPGAALAQEQEQEQEQGQEQGQVEQAPDIIVTAQKRAENLQNIPAAITALTGLDLEERQIINVEDLRNEVPNLYVEQALSGTTTPKMFLRGIGVDNQVFSFDSPIGLYFDGVYIARTTGALIDLFDVERVEFLRGPQGTLFGRNSSVGALRIINKNAPLDRTEINADVSFGNHDQFNANLAAGAPLIDDRLGLRVTFLSRRNDGFQRDLTTGERHMNNNIIASRAALRFVPAEGVEFTLRGDLMFDHSKPTQGASFRDNPDDNLFTFESSPGVRFVNEVEPWGVSGTLEADLGGVDLTSISAYRELRYRNANDVDGRAEVRSFEVDRQDLDQSQLSQEVYLGGNELASLPLAWTVGAFFMREENDFAWALRIFAPPTTQLFHQETDSLAFYSQGTLRATDRLSLTGGLRYTYERKHLTARQLLADGTPNEAFRFDDSIKAKKVNWRAATDYRITDDIMLYVTAGTGFRSGGFNGSARNVPAILSGAFGPEDVFMVEGGAKTEWFDRRLRLNADYYYGKYENLQLAVTRSDGTITTTNVNATVRGIELELTAIPFSGLEIFGNLGTTKDDIEDSPIQLKNTPSIQWQLGATYSIRLGGAGTLRLSGDVSHTASYFNGTNNEPASRVAPYELYNAQIAFITADEHWQFRLSGRNLGDHVFPAHTFDIAGGFISSVHFPSTPRRWLATVGYRY